jgi:hypothetical protein
VPEFIHIHLIHAIQAIPIGAISILMDYRIGARGAGNMGGAIIRSDPSAVTPVLPDGKMIVSQRDISHHHPVSRFEADKRFVVGLKIKLLDGIISGPVGGLPAELLRGRSLVKIIASSGMFWGFIIGPIRPLGLDGPISLKKWRSRGGWCCKGQWIACS